MSYIKYGGGGIGPKRPTNLGRNDPPLNQAETTQAETTQPKRPTAETTHVRNNPRPKRPKTVDFPSKIHFSKNCLKCCRNVSFDDWNI